MFRFTTPYHRFNVPFDIAQLQEVYITYVQHEETILEKTTSDISYEGNCIVVHFTQEETALFECDCGNKVTAYAQLRGKFLDGEAWASRRIAVTIEGVYKEGVI